MRDLRLRAQDWLFRERPSPFTQALGGVIARWPMTLGPRDPFTPTVVVGSLAVGGAGKTAAVAWLAERALALERVPAVIAHDYRARGPARLVGPGELADEAAWLRAVLPPSIPVWAGPRRALVTGIHGAPLLVDGGLTDQGVPRRADIVMIDVTAPQHVFPAGPLRAAPSEAEKASVVWLHRVNEPSARAWPFRADVGSAVVARRLCLPGGRVVEPTALRGVRVSPVCGIARPGSFFHLLDELKAVRCPGLLVADHGPFPRQALVRLARAGALLVATGKDRARLPLDVPVAILETTLAICWGQTCLDELLA